MNTTEIKFRGKLLTDGSWVYGYYLRQGVAAYIVVPVYDRPNKICQVDPLTISQFVGKLKSEDEIYINDLIQHGETIRIVEYRNGNTCLIRQNKQDTILLSFSENPKKVGNIFDNPELLQDAS
jgi:hypothetical protein